MSRENVRAFLLILGVGLAVYFFKLGSIPLLDPDEPRYARAAVEMMETGDWINPQLNGQNRWDKPVLFYWFILWSYGAFGVSEWSARFPSVVFALLSALTIFIWAARNQKQQVGLLGALILSTNIQFVMVGRLAITDMALCFFKGLALVVAFESWRTGKGRLILFAYIAAALAFLTKGPVGIVLPAFIFFIFLWVSGNLSYLKRIRLGAGFIVFSLIALPWYFVEGILHKEFFEYFFILHNVKRFATEALKHTEPFYYYFAIVIAGFFPWSMFLPRTLWRATRNYWKDPFYFFILLWFLLEFVFFSCSKAKVPTYILSIFLPLSLLVGRCWQDLFEKEGERSYLWIEAVLLILFSVGVLVGGGYFWFQEFPLDFVPFVIVSVPIFLSFIAAFVFAIQNRLRLVYRVILCSFLVSFIAFIQFFGEGLGKTRSMRDLALEVIIQGGGSKPIASFQFFKPSLIYYLGRPVQRINDLNGLVAFMNRPEQTFCVMRSETFKRLKEQSFNAPVFLVKQASDKVVVTNQKLKRLTGLEA